MVNFLKKVKNKICFLFKTIFFKKKLVIKKLLEMKIKFFLNKKIEILHICINEPKFMLSYIDFINKNFDNNNHLFVIFGNFAVDRKIHKNVFYFSEIGVREVCSLIRKSKKIILHGMWEKIVMDYIVQNNIIMNKTYNLLWGGDFYFPEEQPEWRINYIKKLKHVVTFIDGDVEYIKKNYGIDPIYHKSIMYLNGIFDESIYLGFEKFKDNDELWIKVGNSASDTNNHEFIFEKIKYLKDKNIKIITPLSYGVESIKEKINRIGLEMFNEKFYPLNDFMEYNEYLKILYNVDIAIFYQYRQQAMGNLIQLLGLGKKVYLNKGTSQWDLFTKLGVKVYDFNEGFDLDFNKEELERNKVIIKEYFSEDKFFNDLNNLFKE